MARAIWKGEISFGLINIQVELFPAITSNKIQFHLLDRRDGSRIRYQRINENTGEEVPWDQITKSYEYDDGNYIMLEEKELEEVKPELTKTIDLEEFINLSELSTLMYDKPYYLVPTKRSQKPYVLLRETLKQQNKGGIGQVVIRTKQHLAVLFPIEEALVLNLLQYPEEVKPLSNFEFPEAEDFKDKIKAKEVDLANQLIESMSGVWQPEKYKDNYQEVLQELINAEIGKGSEKKKIKKSKKETKVVNIEELLKKSIKSKDKKRKVS